MKIRNLFLLALGLCVLVAPCVRAQFDTGTGPYTTVTAAIRQPDGKILIGGGFTSVDGIPRNGIARLNADGSLDTSFNPGVRANLGSTVRSFALLPDGRIYAAGDFIFVRQRFVEENGVFRGIIRLFPDGSIDDSFNPGAGTSISQSTILTSPPVIDHIALQPDGNLIVVGRFDNYRGITTRGICRLTPSADLDMEFTQNLGFGSRGFDLPPTELPPVKSAIVLANGKILVCGAFAGWDFPNRRCIARLNANGTLDTTFNPELGATNNSPETEPGQTGGASINSMVVQPNGQIIVAGDFVNFNGVPRRSVARLSADGALDLTYNPGNTLFDPVGVSGSVNSIALGPNGTLYMVGAFTAVNGVARRGLAHLGTDGVVLTTGDILPSGSGFIAGTALNIFVQPDGKLVVSGTFTNFSGFPLVGIIRLNQDGTFDGVGGGGPGNGGPGGGGGGGGGGGAGVIGSIDTTFDAPSGTDAPVLGAAVQSDGKILIVGQFTKYKEISAVRVARIREDGVLDTDIIDPATGAVSTRGFSAGIGPNGWAYSVVPLSDGKILVGGSFTSFNGVNRLGIVRLTSTGEVDTAFDTENGPNGAVFGIAVQSDGKIVVGGSFTQIGGVQQTGLARLNANGSLDTTFAVGSGANGAVKAVGLQGGNIVAGGTFSTFNGTTAPRIVRLSANGSIDTSFNVGVGADNSIEALLTLPDGKIAIAGNFGQFRGVARNRVARLNNDGTVDGTFMNPLAGPNGTVKALALESSGKLFIGGTYTSFNGSPNMNNPVRLRTDGQVDSTFGSLTSTGAVSINALALDQRQRLIVGGQFVANVSGLDVPYISNNIMRLNNSVTVGRLVNVSSRAKVEAGGDDVVIGGFVVNGSTHKRVIVRAMGPSLTVAGVRGALTAPKLELFNSDGQVIAENTGWGTNPFTSDIQQSGLAPSNVADSAVIATLAPGAYTAKVSGVGSTTGVTLVEVYDLDVQALPRMINISTRAKVQQGEDVLIGGFAIRNQTRKVAVRAIGPSLVNYGVRGVLFRPTLTVYNSAGTAIATNSGWRSAANPAALQATGFAPSDDREPAMLLELPEGTYTAIVRGADGTSGVALVEVYEIN